MMNKVQKLFILEALDEEDKLTEWEQAEAMHKAMCQRVREKTDD